MSMEVLLKYVHSALLTKIEVQQRPVSRMLISTHFAPIQSKFHEIDQRETARCNLHGLLLSTCLHRILSICPSRALPLAMQYSCTIQFSSVAGCTAYLFVAGLLGLCLEAALWLTHAVIQLAVSNLALFGLRNPSRSFLVVHAFAVFYGLILDA